MIKVTKLNQETVYVNADLIEVIESVPDTVIHMRGGRRLVLREGVEDLIRDIVKYKRLIQLPENKN